ncbi:MAG: haloacid dehalogenase [Deltaproteobacteria bacterium]|nr:haloacid dehalogenase [Deltaproteobacteria bacterium]
MALFLRIAEKKHNVPGLKMEHITSYALEECLPISREVIADIVEELIHGTHDEPLPPVPGAAGVLSEVAEAAAPLLFVTARPKKGPILEWVLKTLDLDEASVDVEATGSFEAKTRVLLDAGKTWFVEDRLETCFLLQDAGISPVVFARPWNRKPHPFCEVASWEELRGLLDLFPGQP